MKILLLLATLISSALGQAPKEKIIFLAGRPSHASGDHEFRAGSLLLAKRLNEQTDLPIEASVFSGWPKDDKVLDGAAAIVIFCDSDSVHRKNYERLMQLSEAGSGLFFMHFGVHPRNSADGEKYYLPTVGGYFKNQYSVNPKWAADLTAASGHPIRRGCEEPINVFDEWYYALHFDEKAIPLLTAIPTKDNLITTNLWNKNGVEGLGKPQRVMWGFEKPDGTRGGGFTGGHFHRNWAVSGLRKVVLNTIVWIAGMEVPEGGVKSADPSEEEINANLDKKRNMTRIKLPVKNGLEYHAAILREKAKSKNKKPAKKKSKTIDLLDADLSHWDTWMGIPHKSVTIPDYPAFTSEDSKKGTPLGLNKDPLKVFSMIEEKGKPVLKITGQIYGGLTTKKEFENYHLTLQFKWGEKKWEPRLNRRRDSGLLLHCVGKHGAFWKVWKRSLECQIQERDVGDFFALAGTMADVPSIIPAEGKRPVYQPGAPLRVINNNAQHGTSKEMPHGEWNTVEIYTIGNQMVHLVNGKINMVLLNTRQRGKNGAKPLTKGQIQIQSEAAEIYYRDIKLTPIKEFPDEVKAALK